MQQPSSGMHFVGIGGIGMAALAEFMHHRGQAVTGSDLRSTPTTDHLASLGIRVSFGHDAALAGSARTVVRSSAIPENNVELEAARRSGKTILRRGALLADIMAERRGIAIAGSHGKTTTSALTAHLLTFAGLDPSALIGGRVPRPDGTASPTRMGRGDFLVAEVDESDGSFLLTRPEIVIVTNVDPEHLDHYGSQAALEDAFVEFANRLPEQGLAILGVDHPGLARLVPRIHSRCVHYGFDSAAELRVEKIEIAGSGQRAHAVWQDRESFEFFVPMPGRHNVLNALAALAVGLELGVALEALTPAFESFPGVARRFESKGEAAGIRFVDDYAHHPAEVESVLTAARSVHDGRIVAIFQPHRYSRTRDCWSGFSNCFSKADQIVISEIYSAGESPIDGIDGERLAASISKVRAASGARASSVLFGGSLDAIEASLPGRLEAGDLVLTIGAGDVVRLGPRLRDSVAAGPAPEATP